MRNACLILLLLCVGLPMSAQTPRDPSAPYAYQQDILGVTTLKEWVARTGNKNGFSDAPGKWNCATKNQFYEPGAFNAGYTFQTNYIFFHDKLAQITMNFISEVSLDELVKGLTAKYGAPVIADKVEYQSAVGSPYQGGRWIWSTPTGPTMIELDEQGSITPMGVGTLSYLDMGLVNTMNKINTPPTKL